MNEQKLARGLNDIAPSNSDKVVRSKPAAEKVNRAYQSVQDKKSETRKKMTPVVKGPVQQIKPTFWDKVKTTFLGEGVNARDFVLYDILVPAFRNTMSDMGIGLVEMVFGGGRVRGRDYDSRIIRDRGRSYIDYNSVADRDRRSGRVDGRREMDRGDRARHEFSNIRYNSRGEAEDVLARLVALTIQYQEVTIAAFYELSNIDPTPSDENYGWTDLREAYVEQVRNGYVIRLPHPQPLLI